MHAVLYFDPDPSPPLRFFQGDHAVRLFQGDHGELFRRVSVWFASDEFASDLPVEVWFDGNAEDGVTGLDVFPLTRRQNVEPILSIEVLYFVEGGKVWFDVRRIVYEGDYADLCTGASREHDVDEPDLLDSLIRRIRATLDRYF